VCAGTVHGGFGRASAAEARRQLATGLALSATDQQECLRSGQLTQRPRRGWLPHAAARPPRGVARRRLSGSRRGPRVGVARAGEAGHPGILCAARRGTAGAHGLRRRLRGRRGTRHRADAATTARMGSSRKTASGRTSSTSRLRGRFTAACARHGGCAARGAPPPERQGAAGGRLPDLAGETLIVSGSAMYLAASAPFSLRVPACGRQPSASCARQSDGRHCGRAVRDHSSADVSQGALNGAIAAAAIRRLSLPDHHPARLGPGAPQDATGAERCAVSVGPVDRMFATPPDSPGQCEPGLSDDRPRDPHLCYCPEFSPRATRSSSS
jgi:hypothetical protein